MSTLVTISSNIGKTQSDGHLPESVYVHEEACLRNIRTTGRISVNCYPKTSWEAQSDKPKRLNESSKEKKMK